MHDFWELLEGVSDADPGVQSDTRADILIYRFTGGTTGRSKCAQYTIDNRLAARDTMYADPEQSVALNNRTRYLHIAPVSHGSGLSFLPTLFRGGCTLTQNAADLKAWCRNVEAEKVTTTLMVPTLVNLLLDLPEASDYDLSSLRTLYYGAAPMSPAKLGQAQQRFGNIFFQLYGATECAQAVCTLTQSDHLTAIETGRLASAGRPTIGIEMRIVDEAGNDVPPGTAGEIWLRGRGTISGYYGNPEGTASEFSGRLLEVRRPRLCRSGRLCVHRRPQEGHDHQRRIQRVCRRGRSIAQCPPCRLHVGSGRCSA
ncbi:AMP-binding protein [Cupriavidus basilensis]